MSKMDNLRAMREARYEAAQKLAKATPATSARTPTAKAAAKDAATTSPSKTKAKVDEPEAIGEALCGHRNMSGRTCTREQGHAAKSHRYS